jgi:hypothetical protein
LTLTFIASGRLSFRTMPSYTDQQPSKSPRPRRVTVKEAAEILNISPDAVRARIKRETLLKEKGEDGTVYVVLDEGGTHDWSTDPSRDLALMQAHLDSIQEQVQYLKDVIATRDEELRRKDHLLAALTERIPAIEPPEDEGAEPRESTVPTAEDTRNGAVLTAPEKPSWWRRIFQ